MEWILAPWPWYVGGPLIAFTMFILLYMGRNFGMSSNLRTLCTMCGADKTCQFFCFDWKHLGGTIYQKKSNQIRSG